MVKVTEYMNRSRNKLCIIGAGTAGLCSAKQALAHGIEPTIFEQSKRVGGIWVSDKTSNDQRDISNRLYEGLRTNLPKEVMGYPDFDISENSKSYVDAQYISKFLTLYTEFFHLKDYIRFLHTVIRVRPKYNIWQVIVKDSVTECNKTYYFEFIMICNGHYNIPSAQKPPFYELFKGKMIHSSEYLSPRKYAGENVLIVGAGPSGVDLAYSISKKANRVIFSHHLSQKVYSKLLTNVTHKPDVKEFMESGAIFCDGSSEQFSIAIICTGYEYSFPFLSTDCKIQIDDNFVYPLYKHCINIEKPSMAFIGLPFYVCASQMMDIQARFALKYFSGRKMPPSSEEMLRDTENEMEMRRKRGYRKRHAHMMGPDQAKYFLDLSNLAEVDCIKPVMSKLHNESSLLFFNELTKFRDDIFQIIDNDIFVKIN